MSFVSCSFAAAVGAPLIAPAMTGMTTFDGSHLSHTSAREFFREFEKAFVALPDIMDIAANGVAPGKARETTSENSLR